MKRSIRGCALLALAVACVRGQDPARGQAVVRVEPRLAVTAIDHVQLDVTPGALSVTLALDAASGAFVATLTVPAGSDTFTATAYDAAGAVLGTGTTVAQVIEGASVDVLLRILDSGPPQPSGDHPPVISGASATPRSTVVDSPVVVTAAAADADGDALTWLWSDSCGGTFADASKPATTWSRASPATCILTVTVTANGRSDAASVTVEVLLTPPGTGLAQVDAVFVPAPRVATIVVGEGSAAPCTLSRAAADATCRRAFPPALPLDVRVEYDLGVSPLGPVSVTFQDACGGAVTPSDAGPGWARFRWTPASAAVCLVTARVSHVTLGDAFVAAVPLGCADDGYEPNDAVSTAAALTVTPGGAVTLANLLANDDDWYRIDVRAGALAVTAGSAEQIRVELFDAASLALVASGVGAVQATVPAGAFLVHVPPGPSAASCGSRYALTIAAP